MKPADTNPNPPPKPWVISAIRDRGAAQHERYVLTGENHFFSPPRPISWFVSDLSNPLYDLSVVAPVPAAA